MEKTIMAKTFAYGKDDIDIHVLEVQKVKSFYEDITSFYEVEAFKNKLREIAEYHDCDYIITFDQDAKYLESKYIVTFLEKDKRYSEIGEFNFEIRYLNDDKIINYLESY
jgi:hypothetical protein